MSIKFLVLGGGILGFGGGSADFIFMGARIFSDNCTCSSYGFNCWGSRRVLRMAKNTGLGPTGKQHKRHGRLSHDSELHSVALCFQDLEGWFQGGVTFEVASWKVSPYRGCRGYIVACRAMATYQGPLTAKRGGFKRGGFPDLDLSFLFCPFLSFFRTFLIFLGFSRFARGWSGDFPDLSFSSFSAY